MEHPRDWEKVIPSLRNDISTGGCSSENAKKISEDLNNLLTSEGVHLLKNPKHFEVVLPLFIQTIFRSDVAQPCLKHCDAVFSVFWDKLPKIKKEGWWKQFETKTLQDLVDSLKSRVEANDESWVTIWNFVTNLVITDKLEITLLNKLLSVTEHAFKKGRDSAEIKDKAWQCWKGLIDAFGRSPQILVINRAVNLLLKPLLSLTHASESQISTWVHLIVVKGLTGPGEIVESIVRPMLKSMYKSGEKSASRTLPDACADALVKILSHDHVVRHCLGDVIEVFGACVNSRPSSNLIEQLSGVLIESINNVQDDGASYKLWKALLEQSSSCSDSPILSQACQKIFTDVNFLRWVESSTIEGKEIAVLMDSNEFRDKVLLRTIKALKFDEQAETPKKKTRKGSWEELWSNYCEAYISWWSNQTPLSPKENEKSEGTPVKDTCDYQAVQFLLLQAVQLSNWNPTVFKTWSLLCEACHSQKIFHNFVKAVFDALDEPNFQVQKALNIADCIYKLDNDFCKHSSKLLVTFSHVIFSMEFQTLLDFLNLLETAVLYPEFSSVLSKICLSANEKVSDYDQLNGHKIRTKVSKIMRKLEQHCGSTEKEKSSKGQRAPFRAQSNFLHRLAKAEEKNKTKSPFLSSILSGSEKGKNGVEIEEDVENSPTPILDSPKENGICVDENRKMHILDDSEVLPAMTLPSLLKGTPAKENGHEGMVAEKENVMLSVISGANTTSPTVGSPKLKITNAREVKTVDASSPAVAKKPKPVAGQKSTPKKVTPSKVSYFDDDANDYVMVPPKPKTTPLTEHQMEVMSRRRTDIPALYQDLSQDTQSQQVPAVQEVTSGVSSRPIQESQDFVPGTPSPEEPNAAVTPEQRRKSVNKTSTSAKKLDFNNMCTPPSKTSLVNGSFHEMSPTPKHLKSEEENSVANPVPVTPSVKSKNEEPLSIDAASIKTEADSKEVVVKEEPQPVAEEKSKRKRKSEPLKFSPKLTRSRKSLKSATPDAKLSKLPEPETKAQLRVKALDPSAGCTTSLSPEPRTLNGHDPGNISPRSKSPEPHANKPSVRIPDTLNTGANSTKSKSPEPCGKKLAVPDTPEEPVKSESPEPSRRGSKSVTNSHTKETDSCVETANADGKIQGSGPLGPEDSSQPDEDNVPSSQKESNMPEALSKDKPKKSRKRKVTESSNETPKKMKTAEEDCSSAKKTDSTKKKKKKIFKLGAGGNLENWLLKTDRVPTPVPEPVVKIEKEDPADEVSEENEDAKTDDKVDLDNSEEIVPSTQECLVENSKPVLPVLEAKTDEVCVDEEVIVVKEDPKVAVPEDADNRSPEKPEGSVLERLSTESPNDDDIALVISPSKRQRRAPSVFRGEGDTYLSKEKFYSAVTEEPEEEKASARAKNKTASPTSKKRLQPLGGRSAKMLRLATGTSTLEDTDDVVVTPVRRRESIAPMKYGENWPKGPIEDWVACTPASPYMSPFRSALKKTPGPEDNMTPQRGKNDSMASPLLSSARRKRVMFLDPPVTRGLAYETDSLGGSLHHADVPPGSPYPTWKGDGDRRRVVEDDKMESSPSKRDAERLKSLAHLGTQCKEGIQDASPPKITKGRSECVPDLKSFAPDVSDEVRKLVDPAQPTEIVPSPEPDMNQFQEKFKLSDDFMTAFSETDAHIRSLLLQCFDCANMSETVDAWKVSDCRLVCRLPHSFLLSVKNLQGDVLTDILASSVFTAPTDKPPTEFSESSVQSDQPAHSSSQTQTPPSKDSFSQTTITKSKTKETNTEIATSTSSTQADHRLPTVDEWPSLLGNITLPDALNYFSDSLKVLSTSLPQK